MSFSLLNPATRIGVSLGTSAVGPVLPEPEHTVEGITEYEGMQIRTGDVIALTFTIRGTYTESKVLEVVKQLNQDYRFEVIHWTYPSESQVRFEVAVVDNPVVALSVLIALIVGLGVTFFIYMSLDKVEKISEKAPATVAIAGGGILLIGAVIAYLFLFAGR